MKRILRLLGLGIGIVAVIIIGLYFLHRQRLDSELSEAIAEAIAVDAAMTFDELEAQRESIPADSNSALIIQEVIPAIPPGWPSEELLAYLGKLPPEQTLDEEWYSALEVELCMVESVLERLQQIANLRKGRFSFAWSDDVVSTSFEHVQHCRAAVRVLELHALRLVHQDQADAALNACRAMLSTGRALGDEPLLIPYLVRINFHQVMVATLERLLAHGVPSGECLIKVQESLEDEASLPLLYQALRGERAWIHRCFQLIDAGEISLEAISNDMPNRAPGIWENFSLLPVREAMVMPAHSHCLRQTTHLMEVSRRPVHEWIEATDQLVAAQSEAPWLSQMQVRGLRLAVKAAVRAQTKLRLAIVAVAVERYRLANERWPDSLDQLCPHFLKEVPLDPYDGQPLRYRRLDDGVLIYSIGPDEADNGGTIDRLANIHQTPGLDLGFQLWDPDKRAAGRQ